MYSDYAELGVDCRILADLRQYQYRLMRQRTWTVNDWFRVLPTSRSQLAGDWRASSVGEMPPKWRSTPADGGGAGAQVPATATTQRLQPLNLNVAGEKTSSSPPSYWDPRRLDSDDGGGHGSTDRGRGGSGPAERRRTGVADRRRRRRFDFRRLAESATRRDEWSSGSSDAEVDAGRGGVKVVNTRDNDQSDRRHQPLKPPPATHDADDRHLMWSLPHQRSAPLPPSLKSVLNPLVSFDGYISSSAIV